MEADESFKRPGSVPFKWELRPGVPLPAGDVPNKPPPVSLPPSYTPSSTPLFSGASSDVRCPSDRWRFQRRVLDLARSGKHGNLVEEVELGCFLRGDKKRGRRSRGDREEEEESDEEVGDMVAELQTLARWSMSARKSLSPESPPVLLSSFRQRRDDADWAGYGLF